MPLEAELAATDFIIEWLLYVEELDEYEAEEEDVEVLADEVDVFVRVWFDCETLAIALVKLFMDELDVFKLMTAFFFIQTCFITPSKDKRSLGFFLNSCDMRSAASGDMLDGHLYSTRVIFW